MKHTLFALLGIGFIAILMTRFGKKESPQAAPPQREQPAVAQSPHHPSEAQKVAAAAPMVGSKTSRSRVPKQKHSQIIASPDEGNPIGERLKRELGGIEFKNKNLATNKVRDLWNENIAKLSTAPLKSSSDAAVARGERLPHEIKSELPDCKSDTSEAMTFGLSLASVMSGDSLLIEFIANRADSLPPLQTDLIVFQAINLAVDELGPNKIGAAFERWEPLAKARNPLYRLLALRAAIRTTSRAAAGLSSEDPNYTRVDAPAKLGFYLSFLNESDPIILAEAIAAVATVPTPEARQAIEKFQAAQQRRGDASLAQAAAEALHTQELIAQGTR